MNFKFLMLGAAVGFVIAAAPSCGGSTNGGSGTGGGTGTVDSGSGGGMGTVDSGAGTTDLCTIASKCSADPQPTAASIKACQDAARAMVSCKVESTAFSSCVLTNQKCTSANVTDSAATLAACKSQYDVYVTCVSSPLDAGAGGGTPIECNVMTQNCPAGAGSCLYVGDQGEGQCFKGDCDVVVQNCAPAARCDYGQTSDGGVGRVCLAAGTVAEGGDCSATAFCAKGNICLTDSKCHKFCYSSNDCGNGGLCNITVAVPGTTEQPAVCLRIEACDPLTQNCTKAAESCYPATPTASACFPTGAAAIGAACGQNFCVRGGACLKPSASSPSGICRQICNLDAGMPNCGPAACGSVQGVTSFGICP